MFVLLKHRVSITLTANQLCRADFSFERIPLRALVGMAREVRIANSLSDCLAHCLEAVRRYGFECRSAMFIYDTNECLMNAHHQYSQPQLLTNDTKGFIIDYFDNYCAGGELLCFGVNI